MCSDKCSLLSVHLRRQIVFVRDVFDMRWLNHKNSSLSLLHSRWMNVMHRGMTEPGLFFTSFSLFLPVDFIADHSRYREGERVRERFRLIVSSHSNQSLRSTPTSAKRANFLSFSPHVLPILQNTNCSSKEICPFRFDKPIHLPTKEKRNRRMNNREDKAIAVDHEPNKIILCPRPFTFRAESCSVTAKKFFSPCF